MQPSKPTPSIRTIAEKLSNWLYFGSTTYRFKKNKNPYNEGALKAIDWMQELCLHYIEKDERLKRELVEVLESNLKKIEELKRTPKTQAMIDAIEKALDYVKSPLGTSERG